MRCKIDCWFTYTLFKEVEIGQFTKFALQTRSLSFPWQLDRSSTPLLSNAWVLCLALRRISRLLEAYELASFTTRTWGLTIEMSLWHVHWYITWALKFSTLQEFATSPFFSSARAFYFYRLGAGSFSSSSTVFSILLETNLNVFFPNLQRRTWASLS